MYSHTFIDFEIKIIIDKIDFDDYLCFNSLRQEQIWLIAHQFSWWLWTVLMFSS